MNPGTTPSGLPSISRASVWMLLITVLVLGGCAGRFVAAERTGQQASAPETACRRFISDLDMAVESAGVRDVAAARISGSPHLRATRFIASFRSRNLDGEAALAWLDAMQALAAEGYRLELSNLPPAYRRELDHGVPVELAPRDAAAALEYCLPVMRKAETDLPDWLDGLRGRVRVPDSYSTTRRVLGLYPLTSLAVGLGVRNWERRTLDLFSIPPDDLPVAGELFLYEPAGGHPELSPDAVAGILSASARNPLGVSLPSPQQREDLFRTFAPVFEIDTVSLADKPGMPRWEGAEPYPSVDVHRPTVYQHLSHTWLGGRSLLQLNYTIWFSSRPPDGPFDILAGRMDGITWRVTLDRGGRPLIYDSIHNCGCYHVFFPVSGSGGVAESAAGGESTLVPQEAPVVTGEGRLVLRIGSSEHQIQRILAGPTAGDMRRVGYRREGYEGLRSLPSGPDRHRSLFGPDGLVPGTQRNERFLLWPMGILSAGAMRQFGHHATAFVGRRHFDQPDLFERSFQWPCGIAQDAL